MTNKLQQKSAIFMCLLAALFYYFEYYLRVAPSVMSASLMQDYNISPAGVGYLAALFYLAYTPLQIPIGVLMDKFGPKKLLTFACFLCAIGTYFFAATESIFIASIGRFLVGFGSAFSYIGVLKIASVWLQKKYFAFIAGACTALGMLGGITGELLLAKALRSITWVEISYYSAGAAFILTVILWVFIKDQPENTFDNSTNKFDLDINPSIKISLKALLIELLEIIKNPQIWIVGGIGCMSFLPLSIFAEMWAVKFLESTNVDLETASLGSSLVFLGFAIGGPLWGIISEKIKSRRIPLLIGCLSASIASAYLIYLPPESSIAMYSLLIFCGLSASAEILVFAVGNDLSKPGLNATTISFINCAVMVGGMCLQPLVGKILISAETSVVYTVQSYQVALFILPFGLFIGAVLSYFMKESYN